MAMAEAFQADGIRAVHFDGNTPTEQRRQIVRDFRAGKTQILTNCDLVSEGFDMPAIECCIMLRPTMSLSLFVQQSGRALRPRDGKTAILLDCVANYLRHGLPDDPREWSLNDTIRPAPEYGEDGKLLVRQCWSCYGVYETNKHDRCPYCGAEKISTRQEIKNIKNIKLSEIKQRRRDISDRKANAGMELHECKSLQDFQAYAKRRGYKSGWAYMQWKYKITKHQKERCYEQTD